MVRAEQKRAAAGVGVDVGDFPGVATPAADWNGHFKRLHAHEHTRTVSATTALSFAIWQLLEKPQCAAHMHVFLSDQKV